MNINMWEVVKPVSPPRGNVVLSSGRHPDQNKPSLSTFKPVKNQDNGKHVYTRGWIKTLPKRMSLLLTLKQQLDPDCTRYAMLSARARGSALLNLAQDHLPAPRARPGRLQRACAEGSASWMNRSSLETLVRITKYIGIKMPLKSEQFACQIQQDCL